METTAQPWLTLRAIMAGVQSTDSWPTVTAGRWLTNGVVTVTWWFADSFPMTGRLLADTLTDGWPMLIRWTVDRQFNRRVANGLPTVWLAAYRWKANGWPTVGHWMAIYDSTCAAQRTIKFFLKCITILELKRINWMIKGRFLNYVQLEFQLSTSKCNRKLLF